MDSKLDIRAAIWAGLIAGAVFMMLEMMLVGTIGGGSPWAPPRMIAAMVLGEGVLPPPAPFDWGVMITAMMIHLVLSIILAVVFGWVVSRWHLGLGASIGLGLVFGLLIYVVNFYGMTAVFPWFAMARNGISIFAHAMFGLVLGWAYHLVAAPRHRRGTAA